MRFMSLCASLFGLLVAVGSVQAQQLVVDCDAGDDLGQALEQTENAGLTWIAVQGTCEGNFAFGPSVSVSIEGRDAKLISPDEGVVFRVRGPGLVKLQGFEIRSGAIGVHVLGTGAAAIVRDCDIGENGAGVIAGGGAQLSILFSDVHDNDIGVVCENGSACHATSATIRNNGSGLRVAGQSDLQLFGSEVIGNDDGGLLFTERSTGEINRSTFQENGSFHVVLVDRSHAFLQDETVLGRSGDRTSGTLALGLMSSAETSRFGAPVELYGDVLATDSSFLNLDSSRVVGDVEVVSFAAVKLDRSEIVGAVLCRSGGDATCGEGADARTRGCNSAKPRCSPQPADQPTRNGALLERIGRAQDVEGR